MATQHIIDKALADVRDAADAPKAADALAQPLSRASDPINDVGKAAGEVLAGRPEEILSAVGLAKSILGKGSKDLDDLKNEATDLADIADKNGGKLSPEEAKKLAALQDKLRDIADKTGDAIDTNKNPSLFTNPDAAKLRHDLDNTANPDVYKRNVFMSSFAFLFVAFSLVFLFFLLLPSSPPRCSNQPKERGQG